MSTRKLTKKQEKSLAFRQRRRSKGQPAKGGHDLPLSDGVDDDGVEEPETTLTRHSESVARAITGPSKSRTTARDAATAADVHPTARPPKAAQKRKREPDDDDDSKKTTDRVLSHTPTSSSPKKVKRATKHPSDATRKVSPSPLEDGGESSTTAAAGKQAVKQRFILFVGNLKFSTSVDAIRAHFVACDPEPTIRLLTPKPKGQPQTSDRRASNKSKGCAFLEFTNKKALQRALALHQSELDGRRINVELTAGGGGKGEGRLTKLKERNKELDGQRQKRLEKQGSQPAQTVQPQRHSTTSGIAKPSQTKRTWTVGGIEDDGQTHRGGHKHTRKRGSRSKTKEWGTGVNTIPVG